MLETLETCRCFYNMCLEQRRHAWKSHRRRTHRFEQARRIKLLKRHNAEFGRVASHTLQVVLKDLDRAFTGFYRRVAAGRKPGYPRFKPRNRFTSFGFQEYGGGFRIDSRRLYVFGVGRVPVRWHRALDRSAIKTLRIFRRGDRWYAGFYLRLPGEPLPSTGQENGFDLGLTHLLVGADGAMVENPRWYRTGLATLRRLQRRVSRRMKGGRNRLKAVRAVRRHHERIRNRRKDFLFKLAADLVVRYERIAVEKLVVRNAVRNSHWAMSVLDAGWGMFTRYLVDKAEWAGRRVSLVNPAGTSVTCSCCGRHFEHLTLARRWVRCACGLSMDRDENAALNVLALGRRAWGETWPVAASVPQEAARSYPAQSVTPCAFMASPTPGPHN